MPNTQVPIRVICATRHSKEEFLTHTATGRSIASFIKITPVEVRLYPENRIGLSTLYNRAIEECINKSRILIFIHDDVWITDYHWGERVREALRKYQIVGLAGNIRRTPNQPIWNRLANNELENSHFLSGVVAHDNKFPPAVFVPFGEADRECKLLDGLFIGCLSEDLITTNLRFDERFDFHFYDADFCRQSEKLGLKMGTFKLSVIHESEGVLGEETWKLCFHKYTEKWGD